MLHCCANPRLVPSEVYQVKGNAELMCTGDEDPARKSQGVFWESGLPFNHVGARSKVQLTLKLQRRMSYPQYSIVIPAYNEGARVFQRSRSGYRLHPQARLVRRSHRG